MVSVSGGESISTASAGAAQGLTANYFYSFCYPQNIHRNQSVIRPAAGLVHRLINS
jgi:hypothetical protein